MTNEELLALVKQPESIAAIKAELENCRTYIRENDIDEEDYFQGYDRDSVDIGVGMATVREDRIYDEDGIDSAVDEKIEEYIDDKTFFTDWLFENDSIDEHAGWVALVEELYEGKDPIGIAMQYAELARLVKRVDKGEFDNAK